MARIVAPLLLACVLMAVAAAGCLGGDDKKKVKAAVDDGAAEGDDSLIPDDLDAGAPDAGIPAAPSVVIFWVNYTEAPAAAEEAPAQEPEDVGPLGIEPDGECGLAGTGVSLRLLGVRLGGCS